jgi:hypothetical protein
MQRIEKDTKSQVVREHLTGGSCGISSTKDTFTSVDGSKPVTASMGMLNQTNCSCGMAGYPTKITGTVGVNSATWCAPK